jgi:imidazole glycerol-phosphate synthase subunit HisH
VIAILDYGMGNLRSVFRACERLGLPAEITADAARAAAAETLILPGVGAFGEGMANLRAAGFDSVLRQADAEGRPLLGICLGLQLLFAWSEEHGRHEGLGILPGGVVRFPQGLPVPHMGWNEVVPTEPPAPLFDGIPSGSHFYFAHSFYVAPDDPAVVAATTEYGQPFASVAARGRTFGVQFHPEKSAAVGERLLVNFARLAGEKGG